ncbi:MAG: hypothetical protein U0R69_08115 [Gaiellales bacterium]
MTTTRAAVLPQTGALPEVARIKAALPGRNEVLVRARANSARRRSRRVASRRLALGPAGEAFEHTASGSALRVVADLNGGS